jgi:hypothetical protein
LLSAYPGRLIMKLFFWWMWIPGDDTRITCGSKTEKHQDLEIYTKGLYGIYRRSVQKIEENQQHNKKTPSQKQLSTLL